MKSVAIIVNPAKPDAVRLAREMVPWLQERDALPMVEHSSAEAMGTPSLSRDQKLLSTCDFAVVLGGDGTLLRASRMVSSAGVPMLPIRFGQFGFMTDIEPANAFTALERVLAGEYSLDERMMLRAVVHRAGREISRSTALNDMVIAKGPLSRMLHLATHISGKYVSTYAADGLIIATPTGSTAYSLSAGGPVVAPDLKVIIITPICPHSLTARSLMISSERTVDVVVEDGAEEVMLTVDGQLGVPLEAGDRVSIGRARTETRLITLREDAFFDKLQTRLRWGERFDVCP